MSGLKYFKIYGERRSGTKYLRECVKSSSNLQWIEDHWDRPLGWKHGFVDLDGIKNSAYRDNTKFFVIVKHPLAWFDSMYRNPPHMTHMKKLPFEEFLFAHWDEKGVADKRGNLAPENQRRQYKNLCEVRRVKLEDHLRVLELPNSQLIRYEDILRGELFPDADLPVRPTSSSLNFSEFPADQVVPYYLEEKWRAKYPPDLLNRVRDNLNLELEEKTLGYSV